MGHVLNGSNMNVISDNLAQHESNLSHPVELNSIGCEAWIDVRRFSGREKVAQPITGDSQISGNRSRMAPSHGSLMKSFADLRRKFRRKSANSLD